MGRHLYYHFIIFFYSCCIFVNSIQLQKGNAYTVQKGEVLIHTKKKTRYCEKRGKNSWEMQIYPVIFQNHVNCSPKSQLCFLQQDYFKLWNPESIRKYLA